MTTSPEYFDVDEALNRAVGFHQTGQLEAARVIYSKIVKAQPDHADALHLLGFIAHQSGNNHKALHLIKKAIQIHPETPFYHNSLGLVLAADDRPDAAVTAYQTALRLKPDMVEALNNLGVVLTKHGKLEKAALLLKKAISLRPHAAEAYNNLGNAYKAQGDLENAFRAYQDALCQKSQYPEAYFNLGTVCHEQGRYSDAVQWLQKALALKSDYAEAWLAQGTVFHKTNRLDKALLYYKKALDIDSSYKDALDNMGKLYEDMGRLDEAVAWYEKTLSLEPDRADTRFDRSLLLLLKGNFTEGFEEYEWRFMKSDWAGTYPHRFSQHRWNGGPFSHKKLFVHAEQGLGDTIQFVRYLPFVKQLGGEVIFETKKPLLSLLQDFPGIDKMVVFSSTEKYTGDFDCYIPLLSLPRVFKTSLGTIPADVPYLFSNAQKTTHWRDRLHKEAFKVGLVWAGSPTNHDDKNRSCDIVNFAPLLQIRGIRFYALQKGDAASRLNCLPEDIRPMDLGKEIKDFQDTAAIIQNLDLLISVDTAAAHLAGAMGKPVWTLLPFAPDWRWLMDRSNSPWYPFMRLFRQTERRGWETVMAHIKTELEKQMNDH